MGIVQGKRALVVGVANDKSLAWSIAQTLAAEGAEIAMTYQGEILEKRVRPLAAQIEADVIGELDVNDDAQIASVFARAQEKMGRARHAGACGRICGARRSARSISDRDPREFHAVAGNQRLLAGRARARGGTADGSARRRIDPDAQLPRRGPRDSQLQHDGRRQGGSGSLRALPVGGPGPKNIRVNALSAGPARTLSSSAIRDFHSMAHEVEERSPLRRGMKIEEVGKMAAACSATCRAASPARRFTSTWATISSASSCKEYRDGNNHRPATLRQLRVPGDRRRQQGMRGGRLRRGRQGDRGGEIARREDRRGADHSLARRSFAAATTTSRRRCRESKCTAPARKAGRFPR